MWLRVIRLVVMVVIVKIEQLKDHCAQRIRIELWII